VCALRRARLCGASSDDFCYRMNLGDIATSGRPLSVEVFSTLQVYLGSLGRTYQVIAQADGCFRQTPEDIARLKARNTSGQMVPIGTVAQLRDTTIPYRVPRYICTPKLRCRGSQHPALPRALRCAAWRNSHTKSSLRALALNGPNSPTSNSGAEPRLR
jgi:AcrB/AcrD/AcrF family